MDDIKVTLRITRLGIVWDEGAKKYRSSVDVKIVKEGEK